MPPLYDERAWAAAERYFEEHAGEYVADEDEAKVEDLKETIIAIFIDGWNARAEREP